MHIIVLIFLTFIAWAVFGTPPIVTTLSWWKADWKIMGILPDIELDTLYSSPLLTSTRKRCTFVSVLKERQLQLILCSHFQHTTEKLCYQVCLSVMYLVTCMLYVLKSSTLLFEMVRSTLSTSAPWGLYTKLAYTFPSKTPMVTETICTKEKKS